MIKFVSYLQQVSEFQKALFDNFKILNEIKIISNVEDLYDDDVVYKVMAMPLT